MSIDVTTEKRFEQDIEAFMLSIESGYTKTTDTYDANCGLYVYTLIKFIQNTQPKEWARFENANKINPINKFIQAFNIACDEYGLLHILRYGFKYRGITFRVCYLSQNLALTK